MSGPTFIDTSYVLALVNTGDHWHERARVAASKVNPPLITSEAVLVEIGNALSRTGWRHLGIATLQDLRADPDIEVVPVDSKLFDRALALYISRPDKEWGMTDCISFTLMQTRSLTHVLTADRHFEQAGFQNLLLSK